MLAKRNRFSGPHPVRQLQRTGRAARLGPFSLRYAVRQKTPPEAPKFAVVVSKKVDKRAVVRNRIRRRIYGALDALLPHVPAGSEVAIGVFSVDVATMPAKDLEKTLQALLKKAQLITEDTLS
jgi:ribonuclease P protein component